MFKPTTHKIFKSIIYQISPKYCYNPIKMKINAYATFAPQSPLKKFIYEREPTKNEIVISIKSCSLTRGDVRFIDNYWKDTTYPFIPGLEIIGTVIKIGSEVKGFTKGDVVGVGYQVKSCFECEYCKAGKEQFCLKQRLIPLNEYGGFAEHIIIDYRFVFKMPDNLQTTESTPLLCSGLTVYTAIVKYISDNSAMKVGVVGIGSLGHLAIQFLNKMGNHVTAFSHTETKKNIIENLGAEDVIISNDLKTIKKLERTYDFILSTSAGSLSWQDYIKMLKPEGILCFVGQPPDNISFRAELLSDYAQKRVVGSYIGSRNDMKNMLTFAAKHKIHAFAEVYPMTKVNEAITLMRKNEIPFSAVLIA